MLEGIGKTFGVIAFAIVVFIGLVVGGWQLYAYNTQKQYEVNRQSQQYQQSLITRERDRVEGYNNSTNEAQRKTLKQEFCAEYSSVVDPGTNAPDLVSAHDTMC